MILLFNVPLNRDPARCNHMTLENDYYIPESYRGRLAKIKKNDFVLKIKKWSRNMKQK